jgi:chromosome segregation ATPase
VTEPRGRPGPGNDLPDLTARLRERVGQQLNSLEHMVQSQRNALSEVRDEKRQLAEERDRLQQELARAELRGTGLSETEAQWRETQREQLRNARSLQAAQRENDELRQRCADLEQALAVEREARQTQQLELECLQEQVQQLEAIVGLLTQRPQD